MNRKLLSNLKLVNRLLSLAGLILALYIALFPFLPEFEYNFKKVKANPITADGQVEIKDLEISEVSKVNKIEEYKVINSNFENKLSIPKIFVDGVIYEGEDKTVLEKGLWRRPFSSTPDRGGNTVIVAHRFLFTEGPNTFYHLDKMEEGDTFELTWEDKKYNYKVFEVSIVEPSAIEIEQNTKESIITLYTCTPLWTAEKRLVVKAKLL